MENMTLETQSMNTDNISTQSPTKSLGKKLRQKKAKLINKIRGQIETQGGITSDSSQAMA